MNVALRVPSMTRAQFLDWAAVQEAPHEFDGFGPVAMTGGNNRHSQLCRNLVVALWTRLSGSRFEVLPEAGVSTAGQAIRYPDVLITAAPLSGKDRIAPDPLIVFEVVSPTSGRVDRTIKLREYRAVPSVRRYVIVDGSGPDIDIFFRAGATDEWSSVSQGAGELLKLPEVGVELPVDEVFAGVSFDEPSASGGAA